MKISTLTISLLLLFIIAIPTLNAQIGINATGAAPSANAMLDVSSTTKGALLPRMTSAQRTALTTSDGLTVYDTDTKSYWFVKGTIWAEMVGDSGSGSGPWTVSGANINNINTGNVGIGTIIPSSKLEVNGQLSIDQKTIGGYGGLLIKGNKPGSNYPNIAFTTNNEFNQDIVTGVIGGEITNDTHGYETMNLQFMTNDPVNGITERLKIKNNGNVGIGLDPSHRLHISNNSVGSAGLRVEGPLLSGGINTSFGGFGDIQVDKPGIIGGRFIIKENGNIGIGINSPGFPLNFPNTIGDKISLFGSTGNHYGIGIQSALFQIHTSAANEDIAFGFGSSASFTERFRFKGNGAFAINGDTGTAGQFFKSNGPGLPASWDNINIGGSAGSPGQLLMSNGPASTPTWTTNHRKSYFLNEVTYVIPTNLNNPIPGAAFTVNNTVPGKLVIWLDTRTSLVCGDLVLSACHFVWQLKTYLQGTEQKTAFIQATTLLTQPDYDHTIGPIVLPLVAGTHNITFNEVLVSVVLLPTIRVSGYAEFIPD